MDKLKKLLRYLAVGAFMILLFSWYMNNRDPIKFEKKVIDVGGKERTYYVSANAEKLKGQKAPLVIFLHGMDLGLTGKQATKPQYDFIDVVAKDKNFIALFPRGTKGACDWDNKKYINYFCWDTKADWDRAFIRALTEKAEKEYGTDPGKTFLTGFADGGYFVISYILRHHIGDFEGYGVHSAGGYMFSNDPIKNYDYSKFLISLNVGVNDPYHQETMEELKKTFVGLGWSNAKNLRYEKFAGGFELGNKAFKDEIDFFFKN